MQKIIYIIFFLIETNRVKAKQQVQAIKNLKTLVWMEGELGGVWF